jgi:sugar/nucleoside kinase (ribokinase family)
MEYEERLDYLVIGHICRDLVPGGFTIGGTAAYSGSVAQILGCRTAVLTSAAGEDDWQKVLPDLKITQHVSPQTTTFENTYTEGRRIQKIHTVADQLKGEHIPHSYFRAKIVHLGPIANEVDPEMIVQFSDSLIGLTPQGWMRRWDDDGQIVSGDWPGAETYLPQSAVAILSEEDLADEQMLANYRRWAKVLVLTYGPDGCLVYFGGEQRRFPAPKRQVVETTGAGDIFAAGYLIRLEQTGGNPWEAARFANEIASISTTTGGLSAKMAVIQNYLNLS